MADSTVASCGGTRRYRWRYWLGLGLVAAGLGLVVGFWLALPWVPLPAGLAQAPGAETQYLDRNGESLRIVRAAAEPYGHPLAYAEIPRPLIDATVAAEDRRFWRHPGVDGWAYLRAVGQLIWHGQVVSGGSTISQQLIKLAEPRPRTFLTKLLEAVQALRLEQVWDKSRILTEYLNRLDYGNFNRGPAAAARFYFHKPLADLSPAECAFLAGLPQAPSRLNPLGHFERAAKRQQWVLRQMQAVGALTEAEYDRERAEPLVLAHPERVFAAPHFIDRLLEEKGDESTTAQGAVVRTSLDLKLNQLAQQVLRRQLAGLATRQVQSGAIVVLDNRSGEVLGLVGSGDYFAPAAGQVNSAWQPRSTGSALKPFTYLLALEQGATPATVVADVPTEFATATGLFAPVNYDRHCYGPMRYRLALANSLNISAVKVLATIGGPEPLLRRLQVCGLTTLARPASDYGLGLTIGNAEARLLELANAYAALARLGDWHPYRLLAAPASATGMPGRRVADAGAAYLIADILQDNQARAIAFGMESDLRFDFPVACKTGTSSDFRDNWAFGYTPEYTVGVWVGNPDGTAMEHVSGVSGAAPVLHEVFDYLHERFGTSWYVPPTNVVTCWIDPITGKRLADGRAGDGLPGHPAIAEKFLANQLPPLAAPADYQTQGNGQRAVCLGAEYRAWLATGDNWLGTHAVVAGGNEPLKILFPPPGTIVFLDADLPDDGRRLGLQVAGPSGLQWHSPTLVLSSESRGEVAWLTAGRHEISVRDPSTGARADTWVNVVRR
ncbi:MAG TPA: penicillin-binding protein 1C [Verrucomicrobiae bacterium]